MKPGRHGVWYPTSALNRDALIELARRVEALGYGTLWYPESIGYESMAQGSFLLAHTEKLHIGSSIASIYARDALAMRQGTMTLNAFYGGRFILGIGVSHAASVERRGSGVYGKPIGTMRAYLDAMAGSPDKVLDDPPVLIAALGPKMLELTGQRTAGAIPYNVSPEHTARARSIMGPDKWLCVEQKVCLETDPAKARDRGRTELARYMAMPNYRNNWLRLGFSEAELADGGNDRFIDAIIAWGTLGTIKSRIEAHFAAGADHVCVQPLHPEGQGRIDWAAMEALAPGQ